jgi:hypothetical protein
MNHKQIALAQSWLPQHSHPYKYDSTKCLIWFWQDSQLGPIKGCTRLTPNQIKQLDQLA